MTKIIRITGTSAKCFFRLEDDRIIEADSEFIAEKAGRFTGQVVYTGSLRDAKTKVPLTVLEIYQLKNAYQEYARTASATLTIEFDDNNAPSVEPSVSQPSEAGGRLQIKSGITPSRMGLPGVKYTIYQQAEGAIQGETDLTIFHIADTLADYQQIPSEELDHLIDTADRMPEHPGQHPFDIQPIDGREKAVLIKRGRRTTLSEGMLYHIYQEVDGKIYGETAGAFIPIADSLEACNQMPLEKLESLIYSAEMGASRGR